MPEIISCFDFMQKHFMQKHLGGAANIKRVWLIGHCNATLRSLLSPVVTTHAALSENGGVLISRFRNHSSCSP
jgi:hypothetical protein